MIKHYDVTLDATATPLTAQSVRKVALYVHVNNETGNAVYVGDSTVSATSYGRKLDDGESFTIGPFSGAGYLNTDEIYFFGTENDVVHVLVIPH